MKRQRCSRRDFIRGGHPAVDAACAEQDRAGHRETECVWQDKGNQSKGDIGRQPIAKALLNHSHQHHPECLRRSAQEEVIQRQMRLQAGTGDGEGHI